MSFAAGAAIFNSCDKQGSIAYFTEHLSKYPDDYSSLIWRSKAHIIVGNKEEALRDIKHAILISDGVKRGVAEGMFLRLFTPNLRQYGDHAIRVVENYGEEWTAWNELANYHSMNNEDEKAIKCWEKALSLAIKNQETGDPGICWIYFKLGNSHLKGDVNTAKRYYTDAVQSCQTHTVSHIHLCLCNIVLRNMPEARGNFETATKLNPTLSTNIFGTNNFDEYLQSTLTTSMETMTLDRASKAASAKPSESPGTYNKYDTAGKGAGGSGDGSGSGGDSSDDNEGKFNIISSIYVCFSDILYSF